MKVLRDKETRSAPSKNLQHFTEWQSVIDAHLLEGYGRQEVQPTTAAAADEANFNNNNTLFKKVYKAGDTSDSVDLGRIIKTQSWPTYSAQSIKGRVADLQLLLALKSRGEWDKAEAAWHVQLWPECEVMAEVATRETFMVIKVYETAALVWPVLQVANGSRGSLMPYSWAEIFVFDIVV